ncbi:unnamed protein product [Ectocarpus fasciculatus]
MGFDERFVNIAISQCPGGSIEDVVGCILLLSDTPGDAPAPPADTGESSKMVLVVRMDLHMSPGKVAAQCVHAALGCTRVSRPRDIADWEQGGEPVVCLKCDSLAQLGDLGARASEAGLRSYTVHDAGRTEVASGSQTVLAIGPAKISQVNAITGHLKLY